MGVGELIWVIGAESDHRVSAILHHQRVPSHGRLGVVSIGPREITCIWGCSLQDLELVAVEVEGVEVGVVIVDDYLDNVAVIEDEWVDGTVDLGIRVIFASYRQSGVEGWDLWGNICNVVEAEARDAVDDRRIHVKDYLAVHGLQNGLEVIGFEVHVIGKIERLDHGSRRKGFLGVVYEPRGDVGIVGSRRVLSFVEKQHVDVHGIENRVVLARIVLRGDEDAETLPGGDPDILAARCILFEPDAVNFNHCHLVLIEQEGMAGEIAHTNNTNEVGLVRLNLNGSVDRGIDQSGIWRRLVARVVLLVAL